MTLISRAPCNTALILSAIGASTGWAQANTAVPSQRPILTLPMVLEAAARAHPLALAAEGRLRAARGGRTTAGAIANPVLTYQVENAPFPGRTQPAGLQRETSTYATLPLEPLWQRGARVGRANSDVQAAEADLILTRRTVALEAARAFHRTALAQASVAASGDVAVGLDSLVQYTAHSRNAGRHGRPHSAGGNVASCRCAAPDLAGTNDL